MYSARSTPFLKGYLASTVLGDEGFFYHFSSYVIVNLILIAVNLLFTPQHIWFFWPLLGWGIGLLAHGLAVHFSKEETVRRRSLSRTPSSDQRTSGH
jgi:peptidoglycan biosynthesis protein MviN/MurJ (putative lipid II flippase)